MSFEKVDQRFFILPEGTSVRNTFLELADDEHGDDWMLPMDPRRQKTDSIVDRSRGQDLKFELDRKVMAMFSDPSRQVNGQRRLGDDGAPSVTAPAMPSPCEFCMGSSAEAGPCAVPLGASSSGARRHLPAASDPRNAETLTHCQAFTAHSVPGSAFVPWDMNPTKIAWQTQATVMEQPLEEAEELGSECGDRCFATDETQPHGIYNSPEVAVMEQGSDDTEFDDAEGESKTSSRGGKATVSAEILEARAVAASGQGLSGLSTVMIKNVPTKYSQQKLMRELNSVGYLGKFDFFYLPMESQSHTNRGFAFVNFITAEAADAFYHQFHGQRLRHFYTEKELSILPADLQGFERNALHYASVASLQRRTHQNRPLFFRPLPASEADGVQDQRPVARGGGPSSRQSTASCKVGGDAVPPQRGKGGKSVAQKGSASFKEVAKVAPTGGAVWGRLNGQTQQEQQAQKQLQQHCQQQQQWQQQWQHQWQQQWSQPQTPSRMNEMQMNYVMQQDPRDKVGPQCPQGLVLQQMHREQQDDAAAPVRRFCKYCGERCQPSDNFCMYCGMGL